MRCASKGTRKKVLGQAVIGIQLVTEFLIECLLTNQKREAEDDESAVYRGIVDKDFYVSSLR